MIGWTLFFGEKKQAEVIMKCQAAFSSRFAEVLGSAKWCCIVAHKIFYWRLIFLLSDTRGNGLFSQHEPALIEHSAMKWNKGCQWGKRCGAHESGAGRLKLNYLPMQTKRSLVFILAYSSIRLTLTVKRFPVRYLNDNIPSPDREFFAKADRSHARNILLFGPFALVDLKEKEWKMHSCGESFIFLIFMPPSSNPSRNDKRNRIKAASCREEVILICNIKWNRETNITIRKKVGR